MNAIQKQPWLKSAAMDSWFILIPPVIPLLVVMLFHDYFSAQTEVTLIWWVVLVLAIDVAHVYSTVFRFYWDSATFTRYKSLLLIIPVAAFVAGVLLHLTGAMVFWRVIAYLAVFHFVRQQYGFMRLYSRKENQTRLEKIIDSACIYNATLYPILYWHFYLTNELHWFVAGDFIPLPPYFATVSAVAYAVVILVYIVKETRCTIAAGQFNLPKNLLIAGTYISWFLGIVVFNGDLIFTLLNVVAHGIPYMALVYFFSAKKRTSPGVPWKSIALFLATILVLSYFEEGLWDGMVWRDHESLFPVFASLPVIRNPIFLSFLVPLLALPQMTHYVLDGFIWKRQR